MKIYVGNLNPSTDDAQLRQTFTSHGEVSTASVVLDPRPADCYLRVYADLARIAIAVTPT